MDYDTFLKDLSEYYLLYEKGLKKQANKYIEDYVNAISEWDSRELNDVLFRFAQELCDENKYNFMNRGNGRIPYVLDMVLRDYLYSECLKDKMPQLRWFYELYRNDKFGVKYAVDMLKKAYLSDDCDKKTIELLFDSYLEILGWGAHHFPEGYIITKEAMRNAVKQCKRIISEKEIDERLKAKLQYYECLYTCYYRYIDEGKNRSFQEYCNEAGIDFLASKAYYYS